MKRVFIIGVMLLFASSPVWADFDEAVRAYDSGDFATALHEFQILAEQGDAGAQFNLGVMYSLGQGVPQDDAEAVKWYTLAAEQGHADAQYQLGTMYYFGHGVPQSDAEAIKWFAPLAEQGDIWPQFLLGEIYAAGRGVPKDVVMAHMWFNLLAARGEAFSAVSRMRDVLEQEMTPDQIAEAQRLAREWKPKTE